MVQILDLDNSKDIWIYIERVTGKGKYHKLGKPILLKNNVAVLEFDKYGVLKDKKIYNKDLTSHLINFANYDYLFIEGAGGICSPLTLDGLNIDVMKKIGGDAILVAKDEIGVINNVLLSISKLRLYKISTLAIVLNKIQPIQPQGMNNKRELEEFTDIPVIQFVNKKKNKAALDSLAKLII
mgnify:CR=1 FL=1